MTEPNLTSSHLPSPHLPSKADRDALASFMKRGYLVSHAAPSTTLIGAMLDALEMAPTNRG